MPVPKSSLTNALKEWQSLLGERLISKDTCEIKYNPCTFSSTRIIPAALVPLTVEEVISCVKIALHFSIPLYPISTGNNWGYGTAHPVINGCVILDLSCLNAILDFDSELGLVTLQPGVTQKQLSDFLQKNNFDYMVPVTGAGPNCSIVANALERGYGITPYADHFAAVMELEAVLANGELYRTLHRNLDAKESSSVYKWGLGPYLDGLFCQGNFGIVTQMTIALAKRPEKIKTFIFEITTKKLDKVTPVVHRILNQLGSSAGGITLISSRRILAARGIPYPDQVPKGSVLSFELLSQLMKANSVPHWTGLGAIYGTNKMVHACQHYIKQQLKTVSERVSFITLDKISLIEKCVNIIPGLKNLSAYVGAAKKGIELLNGYPNQVSLRLAYWRSGHLPSADLPLNPAKDGCGLLWFAPILPLKATAVQQFIDLAEKVCYDFKIEPLLAFSSVSDKCFDSTIPLLFDPFNEEETQRARDCYNMLLNASKEHGFYPYRVDIETMAEITKVHNSYWNTVSKIKNALDPKQIIAPGRYAPLII